MADCCVLSAEEVGQLKHYKIQPSHENHRHIPAEEAIKGVQDDELELIVGTYGRHYVTPTKMHCLKAVKSGGMRVIQRVIGNQLTHLKPII